MKNLLRSRLPPPLTQAQITHLTTESRLSKEEIEEWYERFNNCYPHGYLSCEQFITYLKQLHVNHHKNENRPTKSNIKQLFRILDLDDDKHLSFEEFLLFNIAINRNSPEKKLKLILTLYDREKKKNLTPKQIENLLTNIFDFLNIPKPTNGLSHTINTILIRAHFNNQNNKISWNSFSTYVLNDPSLFQLLISNGSDNNESDDEPSCIVTRF